MDNEYILGPDGELYHYGVKGMKWGVRRYQNKDGSLTAAGKKRADGDDVLTWKSLNKRITQRLGVLSGRGAETVSADDRATFDWDVEGVEDSYHPKPTSKKPDDITRVAKDLSDTYDRWLKEFADTGNTVGYNNVKRYRDMYMKDSTKYSKAILETIDELEVLRSRETYNFPGIAHSELYHWGIKGMKWGVRRYQNKDGSLTPAGKKRYAEEEEALKARERVIKNKERLKARTDKITAKKAELDAREKALNDAEEAANPKRSKVKNTKADSKKKTIADMTDEELLRAIERGKLENQYRQTYPEPAPKKNKLVSALEPALIDAGKKLIDSMVEQGVKMIKGNTGESLPPVKTWDDLLKKEQYQEGKRKGNSTDSSNKNNNNGSENNKNNKKDNKADTANVNDNAGSSSSNKRPPAPEKQSSSDKQTDREASYERAQAIVDKIVNANNNRKEAARVKEYADIYGTKEYEQKVDRMLKEMDDAGWKLWEEMYGSGN